MSLSLHQISIPPFIRGLNNLASILKKARAFAAESGMAESELVEARLFSDMLPLSGQIQRASDAARLMAVRVGQVENRPMPDTETTMDELETRIAATLDFLKAVPANAFDGREQAEVKLTTRAGELTFTATDYVLGFAIPNFYFHTVTAYDILRHKGVGIGKLDFLGNR